MIRCLFSLILAGFFPLIEWQLFRGVDPIDGEFGINPAEARILVTIDYLLVHSAIIWLLPASSCRCWTYVLQCSVFPCCVLIDGNNPPFTRFKIPISTATVTAMIIIIVSKDVIVNNGPPCNLSLEIVRRFSWRRATKRDTGKRVTQCPTRLLVCLVFGQHII